MLSRTAGEDTFGIRMASGQAWIAAFKSASPQESGSIDADHELAATIPATFTAAQT